MNIDELKKSNELKAAILKELQNKDLSNGLYDTCLESTKDLPTDERRKLLFEMEQEGKIVIKNMLTINNPEFSLIIIDCLNEGEN